MATDTVMVVGFSKDLPFVVAERKGFFSAHDLSVVYTQTRNSTEEISGLLEEKWDIAFDNGDNVVAWAEGQGADGKPHDLFIFMGGSQELDQALYGTSDIKEIRELKGKVLGVDAIATGYAVVLRHILQCHGLSYGKDYGLEPAGSTRMRLEKLLEGKISGAMLNPRYVEEMSPLRLRLLARGKDYADPYSSRVGIATRAWARTHGAFLVRFIHGYMMAMDWILNSGNKSEALALIKTSMGRSEEQAEEYYRKLIDPRGGLADKAALNPAGLKTVLDLRLKTGLMKPPAPPLDKYYDGSFYQKAAARVAAGSVD